MTQKSQSLAPLKSKPIDIRLSVEQAQALAMACEMLAHVGIGMFSDIVYFHQMTRRKKFDHKRCEELCDELKTLIFPELDRDMNYGIAHHAIAVEAKRAWDTWRSLAIFLDSMPLSAPDVNGCENEFPPVVRRVDK